MKNVFQHGDEICHQLTLRKLSLIKLASCFLGVLIGILTPKEDRKITFFSLFLVFILIIYPSFEGLTLTIQAEYADDYEDEDLEDESEEEKDLFTEAEES